LPVTIRLGMKRLPVKNPLAYYVTKLITAVKSLIVAKRAPFSTPTLKVGS
jgi:hypothetical protein